MSKCLSFVLFDLRTLMSTFPTRERRHCQYTDDKSHNHNLLNCFEYVKLKILWNCNHFEIKVKKWKFEMILIHDNWDSCLFLSWFLVHCRKFYVSVTLSLFFVTTGTWTTSRNTQKLSCYMSIVSELLLLLKFLANT